MDPWIGHPSYCGLGQEPIFLGAVALLNSVDDYTKGCYALSMWDMYGQVPDVDRAWDVCGMVVRFPL
jgi:hypothetical protein